MKNPTRKYTVDSIRPHLERGKEVHSSQDILAQLGAGDVEAFAQEAGFTFRYEGPRLHSEREVIFTGLTNSTSRGPSYL